MSIPKWLNQMQKSGTDGNYGTVDKDWDVQICICCLPMFSVDTGKTCRQTTNFLS